LLPVPAAQAALTPRLILLGLHQCLQQLPYKLSIRLPCWELPHCSLQCHPLEQLHQGHGSRQWSGRRCQALHLLLL
jgi:hypothetical protein